MNSPVRRSRFSEETLRKPVVDIGRCTLCEGCLAVCPQVFELNPVMGYIEVRELDHYPEEAVQEAINICPAKCLAWLEE